MKHPPKNAPRLLAASGLTLLLCWFAPAARGGAPQVTADAADPVVARGGGMSLSASALESTLVTRYALSEDGRAVLKLLLNARVLERLGEERRVRISPEDVDALWRKLDLQARAAGNSQGLLAEVQKQGVTVEEFREFLRLSLVQERLTREALGIPERRTVTGDQQEIWLQQTMVERGLDWPAPPWRGGVVARCGDVEIRRHELGRELRKRLSPRDVRETAWHVLLLRGIEARMPDLSDEARERAIDAEMDRRRAEVGEAGVKGVSFEELLGARGTTLEALRSDASAQIAALSRLWVDRTSGPEGLREAYENERAYFEGHHGMAVRTHLCFLTAAKYKNELNPRTYEEAEELLREFAGRVGNVDDFAALARANSEDPTSRQNAGELGWVTRLDPRIPAAVPRAIFDFVDAGGEIPAGGRALGPVRLESGAALLWVSAVRESPSWERMSAHVHEELRRRFLADVLHPDDVELVTP